MKKIIVACNSGLGTSLMIRLNVEALMKEWGIKAKSNIRTLHRLMSLMMPI